jgi:hypothetical protein
MAGEEKLMDTRLLRIGTHDADPSSILYPSGAGFKVNLGNVFNEMQQTVRGFSIESVGFYNLAPNIDSGKQRLVIEYGVGPTYLVVEIPAGQYEISELLTAINAQTNPGFVWTLSGERLQILADGTIVGPIYIWGDGFTSVPNIAPSDQLATILGFRRGVATELPVNPTPFITELHYDMGGERVAYLHSFTMAHNKYSFDGEGVAVSFSCSFPINVPYKNFNLVYPNQYQHSSIRWDEPHDLREIELRLRDSRGRLLNLQGTEWFVCLRLFMQ